MIHLIIVAALMGLAFAAGAAIFSRRETRWFWAGAICCATLGFGSAAIAAMLFLFARTCSMDDRMTTELWFQFGSQAVGIGFVCFVPFAVVAFLLAKRAWKRDNFANHGLESTGAPPAAGTPETHP